MNPKVIPLIGIAGVKLNNTSIRQNLISSEIQFDTIQKIYQKFKPDGIFTFMDLTVEAEALGLGINFPENDTPSVLEHRVKTPEDLEKIKSNYKGVSGRMPVFIETLKKMAAHINTFKGAYVIGPFTLAGELNGVNDILMNCVLQPDFVAQLVEFSTRVVQDYTQNLFEAGADTVCVLDPSSMMLSPEMYGQFSLSAFQKIVKSTGGKPLILHICGDTTHLVDAMARSGAAALSLDSIVNFKEIIRRIPPQMELIGNLDPVDIFLNGTHESIAEATKCLKHQMQEHSNFVLGSGCDLPLATPLENVQAFMESARNQH
ncbi:MAG: uroporphyrinogen decarboxylase family protein [Candidatus Marinimicrobia bacterium]|nr:uroporphyrinogen decarboxylase family protein [Candidatus Neomarinimicrobiota bacterium]